MNNGRIIYFWHGLNQNIYDKLLPICVEREDSKLGKFLMYYDSLDDFAEHYGRQFIVSDEWIAVTHKHTFGQQ